MKAVISIVQQLTIFFLPTFLATAIAALHVRAADVTSPFLGSGNWNNNASWNSALFPDNGNGGLTYDADGRDFLIWQRQYGSGVLAASVSVPEPRSITFFAVAVVLCWRLRK
jgi:hypothetical protein